MSEGVKTRAANFRELWPRVRDNPQCFVEAAQILKKLLEQRRAEGKKAATIQ